MTGSGEIGSLEEVGHATWPALEDEVRGGWLLRAAGGATRRSNSASPVGPSALEVHGQIDMCEAWYESRGLPAIFRLTRAADPAVDHGLEVRGYARHFGAVIMTRPAAGLGSPAPGVGVAETASGAWLDLMAREEGRSGAMQTVLAEMLQRLQARAGFASIQGAGTVIAIGLGVATDEDLALYMMQTVPERRRQGLGTAIAATLAQWGMERGARRLFLQVHPGNTAGRAFYTRLGFEPRYEYWYRQREAGSG